MDAKLKIAVDALKGIRDSSTGFEAAMAESGLAAIDAEQPVPLDISGLKRYQADFLACCIDVNKNGDLLKYADVQALIDATQKEQAEQPAQGLNVDALAQEIRRVNGNKKMGAGTLAEKIVEWIGTKQLEGEALPQAVEVLGSIDTPEFLGLVFNLRTAKTSEGQEYDRVIAHIDASRREAWEMGRAYGIQQSKEAK